MHEITAKEKTNFIRQTMLCYKKLGGCDDEKQIENEWLKQMKKHDQIIHAVKEIENYVVDSLFQTFSKFSSLQQSFGIVSPKIKDNTPQTDELDYVLDYNFSDFTIEDSLLMLEGFKSMVNIAVNKWKDYVDLYIHNKKDEVEENGNGSIDCSQLANDILKDIMENE